MVTDQIIDDCLFVADLGIDDALHRDSVFLGDVPLKPAPFRIAGLVVEKDNHTTAVYDMAPKFLLGYFTQAVNVQEANKTCV